MPGLTYRLDPGQEGSLLDGALAGAGWRRTTADDWRVSFRWLGDLGVVPTPAPNQRVCHFCGISALSNKGRLAHTLGRARARAACRGRPGRFAFYPPTFAMPDEAAALREEARRRPTARWIQKPAALSRGRGVELLPSVDAAVPEPGWVVQEYVARPHLLDGHRYTLRTYLLVTSLDPLLAYVFPDCLVKYSLSPWSGSAGVADRASYMTNMAVVGRIGDHDGTARNFTLPEYRRRLAAEGRDAEALWAAIRRLSIELAVAGREPILAGARRAGLARPGDFELLALDLAVDEAMSPWVLECNVAPDMAVRGAPGSAFAEQERDLKERVVRSVARLVEAAFEADERDAREGGTFEERALRRAALELASRGELERVYPAQDAADYLAGFPYPRYADLVLARQRRPVLERRDPTLVPAEGVRLETEAAGGRLRDSRDGRELRLNATAAYVWQANADGLPAAEIAAELAGLFPSSDRCFEHDVRAALAEWAEDELLVDADCAAATLDR